MRILLLSDNRKTARLYSDAAEEMGKLRLCTLKNTAQVSERLFRDPFDALISDDPSVLQPFFRERCVFWPDHLFLLLSKPTDVDRFPETLTFCFPTDSDPKEVLSRIASFPNGYSRKKSVSIAISQILQQLGVPVSLSGFAYLREAVLLILMQKQAPDVRSVNDIYEILSGEMGTTAFAAEHAMRHAIDSAWIRADPSALEQMFGDTICSDRSAPSNAAFLFRTADQIKINLGGI